MKKTEMLIISRNEANLQNLVVLINNTPGWNGVGAGSGEDAIEKFHQMDFDMVLLTNDAGETEEKRLYKIFMHQSPGVLILQHVDSAGASLREDIKAALDRHRKDNTPSFSFVDDALKNAGLNITVQ